MDPIFESYSLVVESEKWNIFDFYDSRKHYKQAKEATKQIKKLIDNFKFGSNPSKLGREISSIIRDASEVGATDTAAREAISDYVTEIHGEGIAKKVWQEI